MKSIEAICANIHDLNYEDIDQTSCRQAKLRVVDVLGCILGGIRAQGNKQLADLIYGWGGKAEATIFIHGFRTTAQNAALVNSTLARSFDYEALAPLVEGKSIPAHTSGTTVVTALTMGEACGATGKEILTALLVGDDVVARVLAATGHGGLPPGWDPVGTVNVFGAAAIAGRMLGLDATQLRHAFGLALNQMAGTMQNIWDGSPAFKLLQGLSSQKGIFSAELAKAGWTGPADALFGRFGYYSLYTNGCKQPDLLTQNLGKKLFADAHFKPYPCCAVSHSAIDCALAMVRRHDIDALDIERAILFVPQGGLDSFLAQPVKIDVHPHASVLFNYRYHVANALWRKSFQPEHFSEHAIGDEHILALSKKIELALLPDPKADLLTASLKIIMKDGREFEKFIAYPKGEPMHNPMSEEEIIAKYRHNAAYSRTISEQKSETALEMLLSLETVDHVDQVIKLCVAD